MRRKVVWVVGISIVLGLFLGVAVGYYNAPQIACLYAKELGEGWVLVRYDAIRPGYKDWWRMDSIFHDNELTEHRITKYEAVR